MADDLGYADLSCYGRQDYLTPVLDSLAQQGMKFTHGYANSAVCSATRVGLITGRYQYRVRVGLEEPLSSNKFGLDPSHPTIPSLLKQSGYHTALVGKWHLGSLPNYGPIQSGYDEFWGNRGGGVDYFTHSMNQSPDLWDGDVRIEQVGYYTDLLADRSIEFLEVRAQRPHVPWLLSLHLTAPHWPWEGPDDQEESKRLARKEAEEGGHALMHYDGGDLATYAAMVTNMDANIGRILARLSDLGFDENTVVIFTSDNGGERFSNNWPFTGMKSELLEGGIRVPLIVRWPGLTVAGSINETPTMSMDFLPTMVAAAGGTPDPEYPTDGMDLHRTLAGVSTPDRTLFWRFWHNDQKAVRRGRFKYLKIGNEEFLFDIVADPLERGNLKLRMPDLFEDLKAAHAAWDAQMLHDPNATTFGFSPSQLADHFGWND